KTHLLLHLGDDIRRLGCALHFETEKGEMFNKFIHQHIVHTNRHSTTRDIATRFGRQEMLRHIVNNG
ncbi:hypothetical protein BC941DRAFT_315945, partial [Chlamydoabsidia padenii]